MNHIQSPLSCVALVFVHWPDISKKYSLQEAKPHAHRLREDLIDYNVFLAAFSVFITTLYTRGSPPKVPVHIQAPGATCALVDQLPAAGHRTC
jgi:hypothetical protein